MNDLENWQRESCFTRTMLLHTSLWLQWLLYSAWPQIWTGWSSIFSWFGTIWQFPVPQHEEKNVLVKQDSPHQFSRLSTKCLLYHFSKSWITYPVWVKLEGNMQLVSEKVDFNACQVSWLWHNLFLVSLWTFQLTLICTYIMFSADPYNFQYEPSCLLHFMYFYFSSSYI